MTECLWCTVEFAPARRGGYAKRFCSAGCKSAFETAARRHAYAMMDAGLLSVADLKRVSASRATHRDAIRPPEVGG